MSLTHVFAVNLRRIRQSKGLTQASLAKHADLHVTYINAVENERRNISLSNVERIASALGIEAFLLLQENKEGDE